MATLNRRSLLTGIVAVSVAPRVAWSAEADGARNVTRTLAQYLVGATHAQLPDDVKTQGVRTLLNWVGVAVGGSQSGQAGDYLSVRSGR